MATFSAAQFEKRYGAMCRAEYSEHTGRKALRAVLLQRHPPIDVLGVLAQWLKRSVKPADAITASSTKELEEKYGAVVRLLVAEHATAYKLCKALRSQTPAVYCTDGIAKEWIKQNWHPAAAHPHSWTPGTAFWSAYPRGRQVGARSTGSEVMASDYIISGSIRRHLPRLAQ